MQYLYTSEQEFLQDVNKLNYKILDYGGKRKNYLSALIETKEGIQKAILILRTKEKTTENDGDKKLIKKSI